jgi:hypothetical protein
VSEDKATRSISIGLMAVLTLFISAQGLSFLQWLVGEFKNLAGLPLFLPLAIAVVVGAAAPAWLPHALPQTWSPNRTKRITRMLSFMIAFAMIATRYRSIVGVQYGLFAGTGAYMLWTVASGFIYERWPNAKPPSLEPPRDAT